MLSNQHETLEHEEDLSYSKNPKLLAELTPDQIEDYKGVFDMFDADGDRTISVSELSTVMRTLGQNPTDEEIYTMIEQADKDGSMSIDFEEFCLLMAKRMKESEPDEELIEVFKLFDKNGDGIIDYRDLKEIFVELGADVNLDDCQLLIELHDRDGDNQLDFEEFVSFLMAKWLVNSLVYKNLVPIVPAARSLSV